MFFVADFHIHSKYSRATSRDMDVEHLSEWAKLKGIQVMGTGDFTHHLWLEELKSKLKPQDNGLYVYKDVNFIPTAEISSIYSKKGRTYKVHTLILAPSFEVVDEINLRLLRIGNLASDGRPILGLDAAELARIVFNVSGECMLIPAHAWTPHFSVFGSNSGFDCLEDCFEEQTKNIFCIETGLSSDPAMNWRLSKLDNISLISNSDAHSPSRIGREANVFDAVLSYKEICDVLKTKDKKRFLYTVEFFPEEGKYHYDGHRNCNVCLAPEESKKNMNLCPKCGRALTIGVMNRVEQLADRPRGYVPENAIPYKNLIPLDEIIADAKQMTKKTKAVEKEYRLLLQKFGTEFNILLNVPRQELEQFTASRIAEGIVKVREGKVKIYPGYDGEYGKISIFEGESTGEKQLSLF
ncbi:MAG: endonuclease Q family protein [Candidatus Omnitrophota bacterium]